MLEEDDESVFTYERFNGNRTIRIIANFTEEFQAREVPDNIDIIIGNYPKQRVENSMIKLQPYEAVMISY